MNKLNKTIATVVMYAAALYGAGWAFNHINAWAGIGAFFAIWAVLTNQLNNLNNKKK